MITLDAIPRLQSHEVVRPQLVKEKIRRGATRAVAGHACFAAIGIENANVEVRIGVSRTLRNRNPIRARTVMAIADAARKLAEIAHVREPLSFKDNVIVAEALELCESHIWSAAAWHRVVPSPFGRGSWDITEVIRQRPSGSAWSKQVGYSTAARKP